MAGNYKEIGSEEVLGDFLVCQNQKIIADIPSLPYFQVNQQNCNWTKTDFLTAVKM